ncbi:MAG TPA: DUF6265 family protein [Thermoanaerobaculia bacterium]|nr:DUF6265 family protein [Thermoanaerobaculia bacterium]
MKKLIVILFLAASARAADFPTFMTGAWHGSFGGTIVDEQWTNAEGGLMLATSRTISPKGKTTFEFLRIAKRNGSLVYLAMPQARPETAFPLKTMTDSRVVFENLQHDFPQRILYWRDGAKLCGRIEGTLNGKLEGEEWCWDQALAAAGSVAR